MRKQKGQCESSIDISRLLMSVEKEVEWMYIYQVVKWFQDNIYVCAKKYGKDSYMVCRFITCMKQNRYCRMWALRRLLLEWGIQGSYKDIRRAVRDRTQSKLLISSLLDKLDSLWLVPLDRGVKGMHTYLSSSSRSLMD